MATVKKLNVFDEAMKGIGNAWKKSMNGETILHSNKAINHIGKNYLGGAEYVTRGIKEGDWDLMKTFGKDKLDEAGKAIMKDGKAVKELNYGKIAGSYIGVGVAARVATGGGLYKDRNGNTDIAGIPFI